MKRILVGLLGVGFIALGTPAFADVGARGCIVCDNTTSDNHLAKTGAQLTRGVANVGGCWLELANQPMKEVKDGGNFLVGCGKGLGHTCLRLMKGAGEIVTAPMPRTKDGSQIATDCPLCMWKS